MVLVDLVRLDLGDIKGQVRSSTGQVIPPPPPREPVFLVQGDTYQRPFYDQLQSIPPLSTHRHTQHTFTFNN